MYERAIYQQQVPMGRQIVEIYTLIAACQAKIADGSLRRGLFRGRGFSWLILATGR
jgi:hypothetical protein